MLMSLPFLKPATAFDAMYEKSMQEEAKAVADAKAEADKARAEYQAKAKEVEEAVNKLKDSYRNTAEHAKANAELKTRSAELAARHEELKDTVGRANAAASFVATASKTVSMYEGVPGNGAWGVSYKMCWHSGVHLQPAQSQSPVCAIADGILIYLRESDKPSDAATKVKGGNNPNTSQKEGTGEEDPLQYRAATDNGCVVLRHTIDIGKEERATGITLFSIYVHLGGEINQGLFLKDDKGKIKRDEDGKKLIDLGKRVRRKDELGQAGYIYGRSPQIHIEVICDQKNLEKLIGRSSKQKEVNLDRNGRTDALYGDIHFYIKTGAPVFDAETMREEICYVEKTETVGAIAKRCNVTPTELQKWNHKAIKKNANGEFDWKGKPPNTLIVKVQPRQVAQTACDLVVSMRFEDGDCFMTSYHEYLSASLKEWLPISEGLDSNWDGRSLPPGSMVKESGYEGKLRAKAKGIVLGSEEQVSQGAVSELLRFGRVIGSEKLPEKFPHRRRIVFARGKEGFVDLNDATYVKVYSDADFPHFKGWTLVADDLDKDCRCDSHIVHGWLNAAGAQDATTYEERERRMVVPSFVRKMRRAILRIPSDWEAATVKARWSWLMDRKEVIKVGFKEALTKENFWRLEKHIKALSFWAEARKVNDAVNARIRAEAGVTGQQSIETMSANQKAQREYDLSLEAYQQKRKEYDKYLKLKREEVRKPGSQYSAIKPVEEPVEPEPPKGLYAPDLMPDLPNPLDCWHIHPIALVEHFISTKPSIQEARVRAFMMMIRACEGTAGEKGYEILFGGQNFVKDYRRNFSDHPRIPRPFGNTTSTAAGAYQIRKDTWDDSLGERLKKQYKIDDFSPSAQDIFCLALLKDKHHALEYIIKGDLKGAICGYDLVTVNIKVNRQPVTKTGLFKCNLEWASLPGSPYNQNPKPYSVAEKYYEEFLEKELEGQSDLAIKIGFINDFFME